MYCRKPLTKPCTAPLVGQFIIQSIAHPSIITTSVWFCRCYSHVTIIFKHRCGYESHYSRRSIDHFSIKDRSISKLYLFLVYIHCYHFLWESTVESFWPSGFIFKSIWFLPTATASSTLTLSGSFVHRIGFVLAFLPYASWLHGILYFHLWWDSYRCEGLAPISFVQISWVWCQ